MQRGIQKLGTVHCTPRKSTLALWVVIALRLVGTTHFAFI